MVEARRNLFPDDQQNPLLPPLISLRSRTNGGVVRQQKDIHSAFSRRRKDFRNRSAAVIGIGGMQVDDGGIILQLHDWVVFLRDEGRFAVRNTASGQAEHRGSLRQNTFPVLTISA